MSTKLILAGMLIFCSSFIVTAQQKYFIYFKDKGLPVTSFNKNTSEYKIAESNLSPKTIERRKKVMGENYITYDDIPVYKPYVDSLIKMDIKIENELSWFNSVSSFLTDADLNKIRNLSFIDKIEKVAVFHTKDNIANLKFEKNNAVPPGSYGSSFFQLDMLGIPKLHLKGITGNGVRMGILDSGFDWKNHISLKNSKIIKEYDFIFKDSVTADESQDVSGQESHGTACFSTIAGYNEGELIGAAYDAEFILAKTEDIRSETHVEEDNYAAALIWMEANGVEITSSSLGYGEFDDSVASYKYKNMDGKTTIVAKALNIAFDKGILTFTSAGNEGNSSWFYITSPADAFNVISVGAVSMNNQLAGFSSRGPSFDGRIKPEVVAPGVSVYGANSFGYNAYSYNNGTSLACPLASGSAALLLSVYPHLSNIQMREIILQTSDNYSSPNNEKGYGLISPLKAIEFPNIQKLTDSYRINKAFFGNIIPTSVSLFISTNGGKDFINKGLVAEDYRFNYTFSNIEENKNLVFYYMYQDSSGSQIRVPSNNNFYQVRLSQNAVVNSGAFTTPTDYSLSQNFPNPFANSTKIEFFSLNKEKAELVILNSIGEKVITLYNGDVEAGINTVVWNGFSDKGFKCASGVYYYLLKIGGKEYGKKMVLVK